MKTYDVAVDTCVCRWLESWPFEYTTSISNRGWVAVKFSRVSSSKKLTCPLNFFFFFFDVPDFQPITAPRALLAT